MDWARNHWKTEYKKKSAPYTELWMKQMGSLAVWIISSTKVSPTSFAPSLLEKGKEIVSLM